MKKEHLGGFLFIDKFFGTKWGVSEFKGVRTLSYQAQQQIADDPAWWIGQRHTM